MYGSSVSKIAKGIFSVTENQFLMYKSVWFTVNNPAERCLQKDARSGKGNASKHSVSPHFYGFFCLQVSPGHTCCLAAISALLAKPRCTLCAWQLHSMLRPPGLEHGECSPGCFPSAVLCPWDTVLLPHHAVPLTAEQAAWSKGRHWLWDNPTAAQMPSLILQNCAPKPCLRAFF